MTVPRLRGRELEAAEQKIGQQYTRQFVEDEDPSPKKTPKLTAAIVEPVERPVDKKWAEMMQFAEDLIEVTVHTTSEKNAEPFVLVACNGINQYFVRGQKQAVKRKFVEVLARAKQTNYENQQIKMDNGEETYIYPARTALRYPFTVHNDPNPKGIDWLKSVLADA